MRRFTIALVAALAAAGGCRFELDRTIEGGDLRGTLLIEEAGGARTPAAGARVSLDGSPLVARTDDKGRFVLRRVPGGSYRLRARYEKDGVRSGVVLPSVQLEPGSGRDLGKVTIDALGAVAGRVVRGTDPLPAQVLIAGFSYSNTDPEGGYSLARIEAGDYPLNVVVDGAERQVVYTGPTVHVEPRKTAAGDIAREGLTLVPEGRVRARARLTDGEDHSGIELSLVDETGAHAKNETNEEGEFETPSLPSGVYTLVARREGYLPAKLPLVVVAGETTVPDLVLVPAVCAGAKPDAGCPEVDLEDEDGDGRPNAVDNCPKDGNPDQHDNDGDGIGNDCEPKRPDLSRPPSPTWAATDLAPANRNFLEVSGTAEPTARVELFANATCDGEPSARAEADLAGSYMLFVHVEDDTTTEFAAWVIDRAGNRSPCTPAFTYVEDSTPPGKPVWDPSIPSGPTPVANPTLRGTAEPGAAISVYGEPGCAGAMVGSAVADPSGAFAVEPSLVPNTTTKLSLLALDRALNASTCSDPITYAHDDIAPDTTGAGISAKDLQAGRWHADATRVDLEWSGFGADVAAYEANLSFDTSCLGEASATVDAGTTSARAFTGLALLHGEQYVACVRGVDLAGNETQWIRSSPIRVDVEGPTAPPALTLTPSSRKLSLSWSESADAHSGLATYEVAYCSPSPCLTDEGTKVAGIAERTLELTGLDNCTKYDVVVRARDVAGNAGPWLSPPVVAAPGLAAPDTVEALASFAGAELAWPQIDGATGYEVCWSSTPDACGTGQVQAQDARHSARLRGVGVAPFYVAVRSTSGTCAGAPSADVRVTPLAPTFDGRVTGAAGAQAGTSIAGLGTSARDGRAHALVGMPGAGAGRAVVYALDATSLATGVATIDGSAAGDRFGHAVASVGDVDRDGHVDFVIGAPSTAPSPGAAHVYSGRTFQLLWTKAGEAAGDAAGTSVAGPGDLNGDGVPDVLVGLPSSQGASQQQGDTPGPDKGLVFALSGSDGTALYSGDRFVGSAAGDRFGAALAAAGDANVNGSNDFIVGAPGWTGGSGTAYLVEGSDGSLICLVTPLRVGERAGSAVAPAGDVDGDGRPDFLVGSPDADGGRGSVHVVSSLRQDASAAPPCVKIRTLTGAAAGHHFGASVAGAGDVDRDGYMDVLVGAPDADLNGLTDNGGVYLYSGADGKLLLVHAGAQSGDRLGTVAAIPNLAGNGLDGWIAAGPMANANGTASGVLTFALQPDGSTSMPGLAGGESISVLARGGYGSADIPISLAGAGIALAATGVSGVGNFAANVETPQATKGTTTTGGFRSPAVAGAFDTFRVRELGPRSTDTRVFTAPGQTLRGDARDEGLGEVLTTGDFDGDGNEDLFVGAPRRPNTSGANAGRLRVFSGVDGSVLWTFPGTQPNHQYATAIAVLGDIVGGDGREEYAIGIPGETVFGSANAGVVRLYNGTGSQLDLIRGSGVGSRFGSSLAAGDVDGDGDVDLVVATPHANGGAGLVAAYDAGTRTLLWQHAGAAGEGLGLALAVVPSQLGPARVAVTKTNGVELREGGAGALVWKKDGQPAGDRFGAAVAAIGDVPAPTGNGGFGLPDGSGDIAIGAPGAVAGGGAVVALSGADGSVLWTAYAGAPGLGDFGRALSRAAELDGIKENGAELAVGAGATGTNGVVAILSANTGAWNRLRRGEPDGGAFGTAVTVVPDRDGDGAFELAAGDWRASAGGMNAGAAYVFHSKVALPPVAIRPHSVSVTAGGSSFTVGWSDRNANALGYVVERRAPPGEWFEEFRGVGTTAILPIEDWGVENLFRVKAYDANGDSVWSAQVSANAP